MSEDKATKERLLACAKQEFLEKGYMKASLRSICKKADVTTGALYFFFENKEDLLSSLVEDTLNGLMEQISLHFRMEIDTNAQTAMEGDASEDIKAAKEILHYLYQHYDIILILLTKSQGSAYENIIDRFVEIFENHYNMLMEQICEKAGIPVPNRYFQHWMAHMQIDAFVHLLTYVEDEKEAMGNMQQIIYFLIAGWAGYCRLDRKNVP